jgi:hypothetical protein
MLGERAVEAFLAGGLAVVIEGLDWDREHLRPYYPPSHLYATTLIHI